MVKKISSNLYLSLIYLFLYVPIIVLIVFSFNEGRTTANWDGFTFKWYKALIDDRQIMRALSYTLTVATLSSIISGEQYG